MTDTCTTQAIRCFSGHAVRRCLERGITALHVEQALEQGVLVEVLELDEVSFAETWVLESECPPAVLKLFDGFESYARWRWGK